MMLRDANERAARGNPMMDEQLNSMRRENMSTRDQLSQLEGRAQKAESERNEAVLRHNEVQNKYEMLKMEMASCKTQNQELAQGMREVFERVCDQFRIDKAQAYPTIRDLLRPDIVVESRRRMQEKGGQQPMVQVGSGMSSGSQGGYQGGGNMMGNNNFNNNMGNNNFNNNMGGNNFNNNNMNNNFNNNMNNNMGGNMNNGMNNNMNNGGNNFGNNQNKLPPVDDGGSNMGGSAMGGGGNMGGRRQQDDNNNQGSLDDAFPKAKPAVKNQIPTNKNRQMTMADEQPQDDPSPPSQPKPEPKKSLDTLYRLIILIICLIK